MKQGDSQPVSSFVLRFYAQEKQTKAPWRIKVTHVQEDSEKSFHSMDEVTQYMKQVLGE